MSTRAAVRASVVERLGFDPDHYQVAAFDALDSGSSVLVCAPTGAGKTVVADYAVAQTLAGGRKAFYTTPLKALSNQKYQELRVGHRGYDVGLLTGDVSLRPDAPVVVMTTEVLRNMLFASSPALEGLGLVVLDEVHYLQDPYRGSVWEEVLIATPPEVTFVCLSATVSNAEQFGAWLRSVRGPTAVISEAHRPVPLHHHLGLCAKRTREVELLPVLQGERLHPRAAAVDNQVARLARRPGGLRHSSLATPRRVELVEELGQLGLLPAIVFIFSRAACDDAVSAWLSEGPRLTSADERAEIRARCEAHTQGLPEDELHVLGYGQWAAGLEAGVAPHHAGMIPALREAVEDCFAAGLLKVVFATETLALGINMPARTVVIERLQKVRAHGRSGLTAGEYAQITGRAGRRGLDHVGHAVVPWSPRVSARDIALLATSPAPELRSSFRPTYNLAVNLVRRYRPETARSVLDRSFAQFVDTRHHESLTRRLDRTLRLLERFGYVEISDWRVTRRGEVLAGLYHECDLLVAEALCDGLLDGLDPPALCALVACVTFETRPGRLRPDHPPPKPAARRIGRLEALAQSLREAEEGAHLTPTRRVDPGFADAAWRWARGAALGGVLERAALAPGDFVRNVKQLVDLLRQLQLVAPEAPTRGAAGAAADTLLRGVVAASTGPSATADDLDGSGSGPAPAGHRPR